jgi:transcriptional regulator with XRE-family HTH domain
MKKVKNFNKSLGLALRNIRQTLNLSQEELGDRCGLDRTYVSGIERGLRNPTVQTLWALAAGLNIQPSELLKIAEDIVEGH